MGDLYKTKDMRFVAYLDLQGIEHVSMELEPASADAVWVFEPSDDLTRYMAEFFASEARVEPIEFLRKYTKVRRIMNEFRDRTIVSEGVKSY